MNGSTLATLFAVNPAFLEEIKDSNTTLWTQINQLREACDQQQPHSVVLRHLVPLLNEVRDLLALQFSLEESYGFVEVSNATMDNVTPDCTHVIDQMRSQHCALYLKTNELAESAEELQYRGSSPGCIEQLVRKVKHFDLQLQDHERAERQLVADARQAQRRSF